MISLTSLDIAGGMLLFFALFSLLCSTIYEIIARINALREKTIAAGITRFLDSAQDVTVATKFFSHPLITSLASYGRSAYVPPRLFTLALLDVLTGSAGNSTNKNATLLTAIKNGDFSQTNAAKSVILFLRDAGDDIARAHQSIEIWYNDAIEGIEDHYKKITTIGIFSISFILCLSLNLDTIYIIQASRTSTALTPSLVGALASELSPKQEGTVIIQNNPSSQSDVGALASELSLKQESAVIIQNDPSSQSDDYMGIMVTNRPTSDLLTQKVLALLELPVGWTTYSPEGYRLWKFSHFSFLDWIQKILGILVTTFFSSLGSSFWLHLLNKGQDIRSILK